MGVVLLLRKLSLCGDPREKKMPNVKCPATYIARTLVYAGSYRFCLKTLIFSLGFASDRSNIYLMLSYSHFSFWLLEPKEWQLRIQTQYQKVIDTKTPFAQSELAGFDLA